MSRNIYTFAFLMTLAACGNRGGTDGTTAGSTGGTTVGGTTSNFACDNDETGATEDFNTNFVHPVGRVVISSQGGALASWPGSGIKVRVTGASYVSASIAARQHGAYNFVGVLIDGKFSQQLSLKNLYGVNTFKVAMPDTNDHTVSFVKRTEYGNGQVLFSQFQTDGTFQHQCSPGRTIEVIGENATAGYSAEGPAGVYSGTACQQSSFDVPDYIANPNFENAADTYGAQVAAMFGADYSIIAATAKGLIQNYDGSNSDTMPVLWTRLDPIDYNTAVQGTANQYAEEPNVVVINLGANDINYWLYNPNSSTADAGAFVSGYVSFINTIHSAYPNATIVATVGPTLSDYQMVPGTTQGLLTFITTNVKAAIAQVQGAGLSNVQFLAFTPDTTDASCDYFPNTAGHTKMANVLAPVIAQATGWKQGSAGVGNPNALAKGKGPSTLSGTFAPLNDPLANAGDPNVTGISVQEFPQCNVCSPTKYALNANGCTAVVGVNEACQSYCHIPDTFVEPYMNNPPSSGNHSAMPEANVGEHTTAVARVHYLHSMEHGAVVIAYNCPNGCDADLATVRQVVAQNVANQTPDTTNGNALDPGNGWVILTPDPLLTGSKFAALSWTWSYSFDSADAAQLQCFINQHMYYGRECTATTQTQRTDYASAGCSPLLPKDMSSVQ